MTKDASLEAFAYLFGVDIPGVRVPAGVAGEDAPTSGTGAARWVYAHRGELTPAQQAVIDRTLAAGPTDTVLNVDLGLVGPRAGLAPRRTPSGNACASGATPLMVSICTDVLADIARIGPRLGLPVISSVDHCLGNVLCKAISIPNVSINVSNKDGGCNKRGCGILAVTNVIFNQLESSPCNITIFHNAWSTVDAAGEGSSALHEILTHEVVHCYQNVVMNYDAGDFPSWMIEGSALWLASDDTHIEEPIIAQVWRVGWLGRPTESLTLRTYDAFSFYALLAEHNWDLWSLMVPAWRAAAASNDPSETFMRVLDGDNPEIQRAWAPSIVRKPDQGTAWETYGFGLTADMRAPEVPLVSSGSPVDGQLASRSAVLTKLVSSSGEVVVVETSGLAAITDGVRATEAFTSQRFCTISECVCPTGTRLEGKNVAEQPLALPADLAFSAQQTDSTYSVVSHSLAELCGDHPLPSDGSDGSSGSPPPTCAPRCASSNGDPHMVTVNGHRYDFQAAGEFVLLRDPKGGVEIQARQEPHGDSSRISVNTAIAVKVGEHRLVMGIVDDAVEIHVDGDLVELGAPIDLGSGTTVERDRFTMRIALPDGTAVSAAAKSSYGIILQIAPSAALRADGVGLLGNVLPGGAGLPALADGTRLAQPFGVGDRETNLYGKLAPSWLVDDRTSLFDYPDGRSAEDYHLADFPHEPPAGSAADVAGLSDGQLATGSKACEKIEDPELWFDCLFDVSVTGDTGFADLYRLAADLVAGVASRGTDSTPASSTQPGTASGGSTLDGALTPILTDVRLVHGAALSDDGMLYVSVESSDQTFQLVRIDTATSTVVQRADIDGGGPVVLASGSVWVGTSNFESRCEVARFAAGDLAPQGRVDATCWSTGVQIAPLDGAVWFTDPAGASGDATTPRLVRIDPATMQPTTTVALPEPNGLLSYSGTTIYYSDRGIDLHRLDPAAGTFVDFAPEPPGRWFPGADGVWEQGDGIARHVDTSGTEDHSIGIGENLIGADDSALYVGIHDEVDGTPQLWRFPTDGSDPAKLADAPRIGSGDQNQQLEYFDDRPFLTSAHMIVKLWLVYPTTGAGGDPPALFMQTIPR